MRKLTSLTRNPRVLVMALLAVWLLAIPAAAADLPLASGSPLAGFQFDDRPLVLPVQQNFQMALLTASSELGRSCRKMEAYGWRMRQTEQQRVDQIFNATVDRMRALGYVVQAEAPTSLSRDVTLFTADRPDRHFIFMWSAGEIGLVMVMCESSPPLVNPNGTLAALGTQPQIGSAALPGAVVSSEIRTPVRGKAGQESAHFSPVGSWVGTYTCRQGQTGGTLDIASLKGSEFKGSFRFYPTPKNRYAASGSYTVYGQYDKDSHRILINPGKWIKRPPGYYNTIIVGSFDPAMRTFSGFFQGIVGCTSLEAKYTGPAHKLAAAHGKAHKKPKKKPAAKQSETTAPLPGVPAPSIPAPAAAQLPAVPPALPAPAPGITLPPSNSQAPAPGAPWPAPTPPAAPTP